MRSIRGKLLLAQRRAPGHGGLRHQRGMEHLVHASDALRVRRPHGLLGAQHARARRRRSRARTSRWPATRAGGASRSPSARSRFLSGRRLTASLSPARWVHAPLARDRPNVDELVRAGCGTRASGAEMQTTMDRARVLVRSVVSGLVVATILMSAAVARPPPRQRPVLPPTQYTTDKARGSAPCTVGARTLKPESITAGRGSRCRRRRIGFYRPKNASQDDRYLSVRIYIEQDPSPAVLRSCRFEERAAAMFSRYVGPAAAPDDEDRRRSPATRARRLHGHPRVDEAGAAATGAARPRDDRGLHRQGAGASTTRGQLDIRTLAGGARVLGFDGETALGPLRLRRLGRQLRLRPSRSRTTSWSPASPAVNLGGGLDAPPDAHRSRAAVPGRLRRGQIARRRPSGALRNGT